MFIIGRGDDSNTITIEKQRFHGRTMCENEAVSTNIYIGDGVYVTTGIGVGSGQVDPRAHHAGVIETEEPLPLGFARCPDPQRDCSSLRSIVFQLRRPLQAQCWYLQRTSSQRQRKRVQLRLQHSAHSYSGCGWHAALGFHL